MITLLICVTLVALEVVFFVYCYFKDKNDKQYDEYCNSLFDIIDDIYYHINFIKYDEVFGDNKFHLKNIERLCNKIREEELEK